MNKERTEAARKARCNAGSYDQIPNIDKRDKIGQQILALIKSLGGDRKKAFLAYVKGWSEYPSIDEAAEHWGMWIKEEQIQIYWKEGMIDVNPQKLRKCSANTVMAHIKAFGDHVGNETPFSRLLRLTTVA